MAATQMAQRWIKSRFINVVRSVKSPAVTVIREDDSSETCKGVL